MKTRNKRICVNCKAEWILNTYTVYFEKKEKKGEEKIFEGRNMSMM
jgi:hypothetical protein